MAANNDVNALFKRIYGDGTVKAVPNFAKLMKMIPFSQREKTGDMYVVPVLVQHEHGFTYGVHGGGALTLNTSIAGAVGQAQVRGAMIVLRSRLSYEDIFKASEKGASAFQSATELVVENMQMSHAKRLELSLLYGQQSIGKVSSVATNTAVTLTDASWAPGIWSGMKDCVIDFFDAVAATANEDDADAVISSVTMSTKIVTVDNADNDVDSNSFIWFKDSRSTTAHLECAGVDKIITNTGTLFNIAASSYELWAGNSRAVGGAISLLGIMNGVSDAVNMGLQEDAVVLLPTKRWNALNADQAALRRYGAYSQKQETGGEGIVYHSTNGSIDCIAHPFVKEGEAFLLCNPKKKFLRVGATDITFSRPGGSEKIFMEIPDVAGLELRSFSDQAVVCLTPAQCTKYTGITD